MLSERLLKLCALAVIDHGARVREEWSASYAALTAMELFPALGSDVVDAIGHEAMRLLWSEEE